MKKSLKLNRPSPAESATLWDVGDILWGNDGNKWVVKLSSNGVKRWSRLNLSTDPKKSSVPKRFREIKWTPNPSVKKVKGQWVQTVCKNGKCSTTKLDKSMSKWIDWIKEKKSVKKSPKKSVRKSPKKSIRKVKKSVKKSVRKMNK